MVEVRDLYFYAKRYKCAVKLARRYKDIDTPKWIAKKLKYALQDLKDACLKLDDHDAI